MIKEKTLLFSPFKIANHTIKNRVVMAPMDQYMAVDGFVNDWHLHHYVARAIGQVGLIIIEASAVCENGRISAQDLGIYDDAHIEGLKNLVEKCHAYGATMAIQINHAGRKCSLKNTPLIAPSAISFNSKSPTPKEMDTNDIKQVIEDFKKSALRAKECNFDMLEIHAAHGYLLSSFLSPLSNKRTDKYGQNRALLLQEILESIKSVLPNMPLIVRISADDYHQNGNSAKDFIELLEPLSHLYDALDVSCGGVVEVPIRVYPGYQIEQASLLKDALGKITIAGGALSDAKMAQKIISSQSADAIFLARELLKNPFWCLQSALALNQEIDIPKPYERIVHL
ncbi:NADPH dehydrogenase [Helicobacter cetorum]|uniref:NADH:flavin oxidoreductase/NADH oxidase n=1 Tax=Helicobacter cetorum (strain ATCC BAA-429 / MIT 00-7128) TaxID=182217 RepID=I0EK41_HELC0|nr:NADPH dehydrogenase [Helicobacter cetorum]AFI03310.1 NADH:flavin oxidoreductase/NADH oxidase [Helicobacter cetorum MIT 00-7128]